MAKFNWDQFEDAKPVNQNNTVNWDDFETVSGPGKITQGESFARGAAQGASLGFADEISGGVEALWQKANGNPTEFGKLYESYRNESRENFKKAQNENPKSYLAGELGAGVATAFVPGMAAAKGAKAASVIGKAATIGGVAGAGYSDAENASGIVKDAAIGSALGGATAAAAPYVGKAISKVGEKSKGLAERFAARAIGAERGTIKKIGQEKVQEAGRFALDEGIISPLASTDDMIARNEAAKTSSMNSRRAVYEKIDKSGKSTFNPLNVASKLEEKVLEGKNRQHLDTQELIKKLNPEIDNILSRGDGNISMEAAQELVSNLGKKAKFDASRSTESNELAKTVYHTVRDAINESAEKGADSLDLGKIVREANKKFSTAKNAETLLANKQAREQGNKLMGLTDWGLLGGSVPVAVMTGGTSVLPTVAALGTKKGLERFGSQNAALLLDKAGKVLTKAPQASEAISRNSVIVDRISPKAALSEAFPALKNVADKENTSKKGPNKWANDGADKLIKHDSSLSPEILDQLKQDSKGKKLLIEASDLTPGSKAMENVMQKIRTGYLNKGEQ